MFPMGPRRPMPPYPSFPPRRRMQGGQIPAKPGFLSQFQTAEGNLDFEKISSTVGQVNKIYSQVSPMFSKFIKR